MTLTLKILASLMQMHSPEAAVQSDNQGVNELLTVVRQQLAQTQTPTGEAGQAEETATEAKKSPYRKGHGKTIFRKGDYGKSVHGPQFKNIILD